MNLHLEQFLANTNQNQMFAEDGQIENACYDFISVGAFTTAHTNKPIIKPLDWLMINDKRFEFGESLSQNKYIENEILLNFYSLKIFISLGQQLVDLKDHTFHKKTEKVTKKNINIFVF